MNREAKLDRLFELMSEIIRDGNHSERAGILCQFFYSVEDSMKEATIDRLIRYMETQKGQM